jgi:hypothetical protein
VKIVTFGFEGAQNCTFMENISFTGQCESRNRLSLPGLGDGGSPSLAIGWAVSSNFSSEKGTAHYGYGAEN